MDYPSPARIPFDLARYHRLVREGPCFVCALTAGDPGYEHQIVYQDAATIAFLNRYPTLLGYCLVAPTAHVEDWVHDMSPAQFLRFQAVTQMIARAVAAVVPTERMYSLSLGSKQGNTHLHWHLAPLPPGVPYHEQQLHAIAGETGILAVTDVQQATLAQRIRNQLTRDAADPTGAEPDPPDHHNRV